MEDTTFGPVHGRQGYRDRSQAGFLLLALKAPPIGGVAGPVTFVQAALELADHVG